MAVILTDELWFFEIVFSVYFIVFGLFFLIYFWVYRNMLGGGFKDADKIFAMLGYRKPKTVDMGEEYIEMFFNNKSMNEPDFYIDVNMDEFKRKDPAGVKWVAFYREAPPIPDYITVIDTEKKKNNKRKK